MGREKAKKSVKADSDSDIEEIESPKIPKILVKIPMRRKILIKRKKKPEKKEKRNGSPKIPIPRISKNLILRKNPMRMRKIVMKMTATLILVPKRKWPRAKRVKAREEERKRRVPVL